MTVTKIYNSYCQELLVNEFAIRQQRNPTYSIRAFARDIGISKTTVSEVLNGYRRLSPANVMALSEALKLDKNATERMLTEYSTMPDRKRPTFSDEEFGLIKDWFYLGILNLAKLKNNKSDIDWIADRLSISQETAEKSLNEILDLGMIEIKDGKLFRTNVSIKESHELPSESIFDHHRQSALKGVDVLEKVPAEFRDFTTVTFVLHPEMLPLVKSQIQNFHRKLSKLLPATNATDVFRLNIQFFPLTDVHNSERDL